MTACDDGPAYCTVQLNVNVTVLLPAVAGRVPRATPALRLATVSGPAGQAPTAGLVQVTAFAGGQVSPAPGMSVTTAPVTLLGPPLVTTRV